MLCYSIRESAYISGIKLLINRETKKKEAVSNRRNNQKRWTLHSCLYVPYWFPPYYFVKNTLFPWSANYTRESICVVYIFLDIINPYETKYFGAKPSIFINAIESHCLCNCPEHIFIHTYVIYTILIPPK